MPETSAMRNGLLSVEDLGDYIYHNWALKASGEKVMSTHLAPFAHARRPLIDQLTPETIKMPVTFM
jgi:abhydrolase domain-containing protein 5